MMPLMGKRIAALLVVALAFAVPLLAQSPSYEELYRQSYAQYRAKDYTAMLQTLERMNALRPNHPSILTALVGALALNGRSVDALGVMSRLVSMKVYFDPSDADFDSLRSSDRFMALAKNLESLKHERIGNATVAFRIPERGLITEGLAYDAASGSFD
jgi:hypothetical protein